MDERKEDDFSFLFATFPQLLIVDILVSYLSIEAIDMEIKNGVTLLSIPPHCHRMQPIDFSIFGKFNEYFKRQRYAWLFDHSN